jgi:hypothetical protein
MKSKHFFPLLAAIAVLAVGMANAQLQNTHVRADVPFTFMVGTQTFPAGQYTVRQMNDVGNLAIVGGGSALAIASSHSVQSAGTQRLTKLVFHRYGDRYFLYQVWVQGENTGRQLPRTSLERELASNRQPNSVAVLAAK